jgi:hypothetical protein
MVQVQITRNIYVRVEICLFVLCSSVKLCIPCRVAEADERPTRSLA